MHPACRFNLAPLGLRHRRRAVQWRDLPTDAQRAIVAYLKEV